MKTLLDEVDCTTEDTPEWLRIMVPKLADWDGTKPWTYASDNLSSQSHSERDILNILIAHNGSSQAIVESNQSGDKSKFFMNGVDDKYLKAVESRKFHINYIFGECA